jgi:hypothetical protein
MKAVLLLTAILSSICVSSASAGTCAPTPRDRRDNEKKYRARQVTGDKAFREGKYEKARSEYRAALAFQDEDGAADAYFRVGEADAMLGNFDKAYSCIIESGPGKIPANRILAPGIPDPQARQAAQILLDTIQANTPRYPYATFPEYLALAAILRKSGLAIEAQAAEEEGRISRQAADAWDAALVQADGRASLAAADRAAMEIYERAHRPETAEILRAQAALEPPLPRKKRSFWYLLVTANL